MQAAAGAVVETPEAVQAAAVLAAAVMLLQPMELGLQASQTPEAGGEEVDFLNPPWLTETAQQAAPASLSSNTLSPSNLS